MKICNNQLKIAGIVILISFILDSCGQTSIPQELTGQWTTNEQLISVRTKPEGNWKFTSDSAIITFTINEDRTVDGSIGMAKFENGKIKLSWLLPVKMTGIAITVECGGIGKIFENDPLDSKEVQLWLSPIINGTIDGELRYTQGLAYFPMAGGIFTKTEE